jgi:hypothetical protein
VRETFKTTSGYIRGREGGASACSSVEREGEVVLASFSPLRYPNLVTEPDPKLTPATPADLADSLSFALRFEGRKSQHDSDRLNADIVAKRLVRYLDKAGYVVMKKPPLGGHGQMARGFGQRD